jgi:hypothetical protein
MTKASQSGSISKTVSVTTSDPAASRLSLRLTFQLVNPVTVLPRNRVYLSGVSGDEPTSTLILRRDDGEPLELTGIAVQDARLVVTTENVTEAASVGNLQARPGDVLLRVSAVAELDATTANGRFQIGTNHPEAASIDIMYSLRIRSVIEHRPNQLRLVLEQGNTSGRTMLGRLQHNRHEDFVVRGARSSAPSLFTVKLVDGEGAKRMHTVAVMFNDEVLPGAFSGRRLENVIVTTDDDRQPEIRIPVLLEARTPRVRRPAS